jgi:hypothetical protein
MPNIRLTDRFGLDLDIQPNAGSAFAKYFRNLARFRFAELNAEELRGTSLANLPVKRFAAGLTAEAEAGPATFRAAGGATLSVTAAAGGGTRVRLSIGASVAGDLDFGFGAGSSFEVANDRPFEAATPFGEALRELVGGYGLPRDVEDLAALPTGVVVSVEGRGSVRFAGEASLLTAVNPLAAVNLPIPSGVPLPQIKTGAALSAGASFEVFGEYELRAEKLDGGRVRLGWSRRRGSEFEVKATARAGLLSGGGGGLGSLATQVLGGLLAEPPSGEFLAGTGLSPEQIAQIEGAVRAGVERSLEVALRFELGALRAGQTAFLFELDLAALGDPGREAVERGLRGDLSGLTEAPPTGVRMVESVLESMRRARHSFRVNLLGIYNLREVTELTRVGKVLFDPESGDLVITDSATGVRLESERVNFGAESGRLRRLLADTFLITAAYRAGKLAVAEPDLESCHTYFELQARTRRQALKDNLDVAQALGLLTEVEKQDLLGERDDFGRTTLYAETRYDDQRTEGLFLRADGSPRDQEEYERAGREALQMLIQPGDADDYRRRPAVDDALWKQMRSLGQFEAARLFPERQRDLILSDYVLIVWWAETMHATARKLAEVRRFLAAGAAGPDDPRFGELREDLAEHLKAVAANTKPQFGEPWGLLAMDRVEGRAAQAVVEVTGPAVALRRRR